MTRSKRRKSAITAVSVLAVIGATVAMLLGTNATGSGTGGDLTRMSNHGRPVDPGPRQRKEMENVEATSVALLSERDNRSFYRLSRDDGNVCYAIDNSTEPDHIGNTVCPLTATSFPTPNTPVLDLSVFESTSHVPGDFHVVAAQGFAADGVASVVLVDGNGHFIARRRSANNVYALDVPPGRVATAVVAYDADGAEVFRVP